jgi:hypothetical protein
MLRHNKNDKNPKSNYQQGFITMIIMMIIIMAAVIFLAYKNVVSR